MTIPHKRHVGKNDLNNDLMNACSSGDCARARKLIAQGADVNAKHGWLKTTCLHQAAQQGYPEIVRLLLDNNADVNAKGTFGTTPLFEACKDYDFDDDREKNHTLLAEMLLKNGADANARYSDNNAILHRVVLDWDDGEDLVRLLCDYGADVNARDSYGNTPLHLLAKKTFGKACMEVLLEYGADVFATDDLGQTPREAHEANYCTVLSKINLLKQWEQLTREGKRSIKRPTFGKNVQPSLTTKDYLALSNEEIFKRLTAENGLNEARHLFADDFEQVIRGLDYKTAMRIYVHIYKHLTKQEKAIYEKKIKSFNQQQKIVKPLIKSPENDR